MERERGEEGGGGGGGGGDRGRVWCVEVRGSVREVSERECMGDG